MEHVEPTWRDPHPDGSVTTMVVTDRRHGDLAVGLPPAEVEPRRRAVVDAPWVWVRQVHGADVVVSASAGHGAGSDADAVVTAALDAPISVTVADCAPVLLSGRGGVGVVHAGWRGLAAGVIDAAVDALHGLGATHIRAVLGPCIHPGAYEFGVDDLDRLEAMLGPTVRGTTVDGRPALDMPAAVAAALDAVGVPLAATVGGCTATEADLRWSHRARREPQRQAMVAWRSMP